MPAAAVNGIDVWYADSGGTGPAVVLSHGFLMDHTMFDPQVSALARAYRMIRWDQRGFGGTRAPGPFSYWDSAADLLGLMDQLQLRRAVLAGMSQGGFVSLRAALLAPERVRALILIDSQAGQEDPALAAGYEQLHDIWLAQGPAPVQDVVSSVILGPGRWHSWHARWAAGDREQFSLAFRCLMDRDDVTGQLGRIRCPALIVHGTADAAIPLRRAEMLRDGLGGQARLALIENGPHACNLTHPEEVNTVVGKFLRSVTGS
jgi:pimeloyl-ACP methyl ester carboxylesterase